MLLSILLFKNSFVEIVTITFTSLIFLELLNIISNVFIEKINFIYSIKYIFIKFDNKNNLKVAFI